MTADVLAWAQKILARRGQAPHLLLEIRETASVDDAQNAFHKLAKRAHPDLHRNTMSPEDLETLTTAYSIVAGAYQAFRSSNKITKEMRPLAAREVHVTPGAAPPATGHASQMSSRALVYYRKAELALRRGDLSGAVLQLKMAIAADPSSAFLRTALAEVESELARG